MWILSKKKQSQGICFRQGENVRLAPISGTNLIFCDARQDLIRAELNFEMFV